MSSPIGTALSTYILDDPDITAVLGSKPNTRLYATTLPQSNVGQLTEFLPSSVYTEISLDPNYSQNEGDSGTDLVGIQIDHYADTKAEALRVAKAFRHAMSGFRGQWSTLNIMSCFLNNQITTADRDIQKARVIQTYAVRYQDCDFLSFNDGWIKPVVPTIGPDLDSNLLVYYKFDEASGMVRNTAVDNVAPGAHNLGSGGNVLTTNVAASTGIIGNAPLFASAGFEAGELHTLNNYLVFDQGNDFFINFWAKIITINAALPINYLVSSMDFSQMIPALAPVIGTISIFINNFGILPYSNTDILFSVKNAITPAAPTVVTASNFGAPPLNTWFMVSAWKDTTANTISIAINNGTPNTAAINGQMGAIESGSLTFGGAPLLAGFVQSLNGQIDETPIYNMVPTAAQLTAFYNSGNGITYPFP